MTDTPIKMLSIDDTTVTTNLDRSGYRKMGVQVSSSSSYHDAVEILQSKEIDVIVINMDYIEIDAPAITNHIKADDRWKDITIVVTSVQSSARIRNQALDAGADLFVEQPIPRTFFIEKIKGLLEQQARTTERVEIKSEVTYEVSESTFSSPIGDLSNSGILISTDAEFEDGTTMLMTFVLPHSSKPLKITGEVVRTIHHNPNTPDRLTGLGVRFIEFHGDTKSLLESYVSRTSGRDTEMQYYL